MSVVEVKTRLFRHRDSRSRRFRRVPIALPLLIAALVGWVGYFTTRSYFFYDDYIYLRDAQRYGLSVQYLFRQLNVHFAPGYRLVEWLFQNLVPLNFGVAQVLLLLGFACSVFLVHRLLVELFGTGRGPLVLTLLYGTSLVHVEVIQWWSSGLQIIPSVLFSLLSMLAYLRFYHRGDRRLLALSVAAFLLGSMFYIKAMLVPIYLILMRLFVTDPDMGLGAKLSSLRREHRVWATYFAPVGLYLLVYMAAYWTPSKSPTWSLLVQYLHISWVRVFVPSFGGLHVPGAGPANETGVVLTQVVFLAVVGWSIVRRRAAWRAWAFFAAAFLVNALLVGWPRLNQWGAGVGYFLRYYPEVTYLLPLALGAAFLAKRQVPGANGKSNTARRLGAGALTIGVCVHLVLAWTGAAAVARESPGRLAGPYMRNVISGIDRVKRAGPRPTILDGTVPDYVVASWSVYGAPYYNRYSEVFPLIDDRLVFDRLNPPLFEVRDDGTLQAVAFRPEAGGSAAGEAQKGALVVSGGQVETRGDQLCVTSPPSEGARAELTPAAMLGGAEWFLALRYSSDARATVPLSVDHGSGYLYPHDRTVELRPGTAGSLLTRLGPDRITRLRLDLPPRSRTCLKDIEVGRVVAEGSGRGEGPALAVSGGLDSFSRFDASNTLGTMPGGPSWRAVTGGWAVALGQAYPASPAPGRSVAVIGLGQGDGAVQVRVVQMVQGAGVVFRYRDPANYWYVAAVPAYGSWAVVKVVDGNEEVVGNTGPSPVGDGTTVAVRFQGPRIDVAVDGVVKKTVSDGALADAPGVGMAVPGPDAAKARFDDFRAALPNGQAPPAA